MAVDWHSLSASEDDPNEELVPASKASLKDKATLVGRMGYSLLSVGTSAWRVRAAMNKTARALGITCNADIGLTTIELTCYDHTDLITAEMTLPTTGINTDKLHARDDFADGFEERVDKYSVQQFHRIFDKITSLEPNYKPWQLGLASGSACCAFTFLLGGGLIEMICAFFGAGIGNFVRKKMLEKHITLTANVSIAVCVACCVYVLSLSLLQRLLGITESHSAGYICSMLFIIPGFPLITGGLDLAKLELRSGAERILYAVIIITTATITGWITAVAFSYSPGDLPEPVLPPLVKLVCIIVASFVGVFGFSMMFNSPPKMALAAGLIGLTANTLRMELLAFTPIQPVAAAFVGAMTAGLIASAVRGTVGLPRITLTVPSIVIMVPGMFMYKAIYFMALANTTDGLYWLTRAIFLVCSLPLGLVFSRILTDKNFRMNS